MRTLAARRRDAPVCRDRPGPGQVRLRRCRSTHSICRLYHAAGRRVWSAVGGRNEPDLPRSVRLRLAFEELGPTLIKFGQALSTHADLLPADVIAELALLQDAVPPLPAGAAEQAIQQALGHTVDDLFSAFDPVPLAAASIAQVHRATLTSGEKIAIKVRRPGIETVIESDLAILSDLAAAAERHIADASLYSLRELVAEFARTIRQELDLVREGRLLERVASQSRWRSDGALPAYLLAADHIHRVDDGVPGWHESLCRRHSRGIRTRPADRRPSRRRRGLQADTRARPVSRRSASWKHPRPCRHNVVAFVDFGIIDASIARCGTCWRKRSSPSAGADAERLAEIVVKVATPLRAVDHGGVGRWISTRCWTSTPACRSPICRCGRCSRSITEAMSRHRLRLPADMLLLIKSVSTIEAVGRQLDPSFRSSSTRRRSSNR